MSLKWRLALLFAAVSAVGIGLASVAGYVSTERELDRQTRDLVRTRAVAAANSAEVLLRPGIAGRRRVAPVVAGPDVVVNVRAPDGDLLYTNGPELPVPDGAESAVRRPGAELLGSSFAVDGVDYRAATVAARGLLVTAARELTEQDDILDRLRNRLVLIGLVGSALAAAVGWVVARQTTQPITRLTAAAERVAETEDLSAPIVATASGETGRLAGAFNRMLGALAGSREQQRQLVDDASHELRTPLTSLRTNVAVLRRSWKDLEESDRRRLLDDVESELSELSELVEELVVLARSPGADDEPARPVPLGELVDQLAERTRRRTGRIVDSRTDGTVVVAQRARLERAVSNLLANAAKFSPEGLPIAVHQSGGRVAVVDRGPGIDPADRSKVFERFYRAESARSAPGSGLGLSIVAQTVADHGGSVFVEDVEDAEGGGTAVGFEIPTATVEP